jgi:3-oxoadipate enol-lactonase
VNPDHDTVRRTVTTDDGVTLRVATTGDPQAPPLLLCSSLGTDVTMWGPQLAVWSATHHVVRFDQRGHGASDAPAGPYQVARLGRDAVAVLDALDIGRADVCGLSLGGLVALWLGIEAPDRVARLVLADTAARVGSEDAWRTRAATVRAEGMDAITDLVLDRFFSPTFRATGDPAVDQVAATLRATAPEGYAGSCEALAVADLRDRVGEVVAPTLVIVGTADEATPPSDAHALVADLADGRLEELPDAGHLANLEQPVAFGRLVADHLAATS